MAKYKVNGIQYDTDGEDIELPKELEIEVSNYITNQDMIEELLSNEISNITGFCHSGFSYHKI